MENFTSYQYAANNADSYNKLATYAIFHTSANVSLFPGKQTLVVAPTPENPDVVKELGEFIDKEALDFRISPIDGDADEILALETADSDSLRRAIDLIKTKNEDVENSLQTRLEACENNLSQARKDKDNYQKWWLDSQHRENRVKEQVQAIAVLMNSIYPDRE